MITLLSEVVLISFVKDISLGSTIQFLQVLCSHFLPVLLNLLHFISLKTSSICLLPIHLIMFPHILLSFFRFTTNTAISNGVFSNFCNKSYQQ
jgi:hypothetical protein